MRGGLEHWNRVDLGTITIRLMIETGGGTAGPGGPFPGPARGPRGGRSGEVPGGVLGCLERCFCVLLGCAGGALSVFKSSVRQRNSAERGSATCTTQGLSLSLSNSRSLTAALSLPLRSRTCWRFFLGRLGGVNRAVLKAAPLGRRSANARRVSLLNSSSPPAGSATRPVAIPRAGLHLGGLDSRPLELPLHAPQVLTSCYSGPN